MLKTKRIRKRYKVIAIIASLFILLFGLIFIVRYYLNTNPIEISFNETRDNTSILGLNDPLEINIFNNRASENTTQELIWGADISSSYLVDSFDGLAINYMDINGTHIFRVKEDALFKLFEIPLSAEKTQIYNDDSISYLTTKRPFPSQTLFLSSRSGNNLEINLGSERVVLDYIYLPSENNFLSISIDQNDFFFVEQLNLDGSINEIFEFNNVEGNPESTRILSYSNNSIQFKLQSICYQIDLSTKTVSKLRCEFAKYTNNKFNLIVNENAIQSYNPQNGEIENFFPKEPIKNLIDTSKHENFFSMIFSAVDENKSEENSDLENKEEEEITEKQKYVLALYDNDAKYFEFDFFIDDFLKIEDHRIVGKSLYLKTITNDLLYIDDFRNADSEVSEINLPDEVILDLEFMSEDVVSF